MKVCSRCHKEKSLEDFHNDKRSKDGKTRRCKSCNVEYQKEWALRNPERAKTRWKKYAAKARLEGKDRARRAQRIHRISENEYNELISRPLCEICQTSFENVISHIDHDHKTGSVRGLLCTNCNTGIGNLRDNVALLQNAILYLQKYEVV